MKWKNKYFLCLIPFLSGVMLFYILPFFRIIYYSVINNQFMKEFVGLQNYIDVLENQYFQTALKNSILIILVCVPTSILLSTVISWFVTQSDYFRYLSISFILPVVIPTSVIVPIWREFFHSIENALPIYLLFIYKNIGIDIILISAAIKIVPTEIYEAAKTDGATKIQLFKYITIPCIMPSIIFSTLLTVANSFRVYRESYLYYGSNYPPDYSYTLQYYMNNNFLKLDFQALSCGALINMLMILVAALIMLKLQRKYSI